MILIEILCEYRFKGVCAVFCAKAVEKQKKKDVNV